MGKVIAIPPISKILESALDLAAKGIRVFPLAEGTSVPPKGFFGFQKQATTDPDKIREWWAENPNYNVAVATGQGLTVVDVDVKSGKQGAESLETLELMGLPLDGFRVKTPSGGEHIYLFSDHPHRNSVEKLPDLPGIDIRGEGGYVVGPGSTRTDFPGKPYRASGERFPKAPDWLDKMLIDAAPKHADRTEQPLVELDLPHNVANAIVYLEQRAPEAIEGAGGNDATYKVAGRLRDYGLSEGKAWEVMLDHWNEQKAAPMWDPEALLDVVQNAYRYATGAWGGEDTSVGLEAVDDIANSRKSSAAGDGEDAQSESDSNAGLARKRGFHSISFADAASGALDEAIEPLVDGVMDQGSAVVLYGQSNSGKTFIALSIAAAISSGRDWAGKAVHPGACIYVAAEAGEGAKRRFAALRTAGLPDGTPLRLSPCQIDIFAPNADTAAIVRESHVVASAGLPVRLIVIDTLARSMGGGDENSATDMAAIIKNIDRIRLATGAAVMVVHHTGKDESRGARGSTALRAAIDTEIHIDRKQSAPGWIKCTKQRDGEYFNDISFQLKSVPIGTTKSGKAVTSCVVTFAGQGDGHDIVEIEPSPAAMQLLQTLRDLGGSVSSKEWFEAHHRALGKPLSDSRLRTLKSELTTSGKVIVGADKRCTVAD